MKAMKMGWLEEDFIDLIAQMTKRNPAERMTIKEARDHPWMQQNKATKEQVASHFYSLLPENQ